MNEQWRETERCAWEALQEQASSSKATNLNDHFTAFLRSEDCLADLTTTRMLEQGLATGNTNQILRNAPVVLAIEGVYLAALHLGLIIPGRWDQSMDWDTRNGAYQFSPRGLAFFRNGEVSLSVPGLLIDRLREIVSEGHLEPGVVPLVEEAQRCWMMGCLRAAMVLIGLASEEVCTSLLDQLSSYLSPPAKGDTLYCDWEKASNDALSFYSRWQAGLAILGTVKQGLRKAYGTSKPDWWSVWEPLPGAIQPYAEAVRIARNTAAHSVDDVFTPAQVGLLLASLPTMLQVIAELTQFVESPPEGVALKLA